MAPTYWFFATQRNHNAVNVSHQNRRATRIGATTAAEAMAEPIRAELIEELRERARKAEERELADLRQRHDDLTTSN